MVFFSGSGGMMAPGHSRSSTPCSHVKSLYLRMTVNVVSVIPGHAVTAVTLYVMNDFMPSSCFCGSETATVWRRGKAAA